MDLGPHLGSWPPCHLLSRPFEGVEMGGKTYLRPNGI